MTERNRFQRVGSSHNSGVGRAFEDAVRDHFAKQGIALERSVAVPIGVDERQKLHRFDLGSKEPAVLVECKSHTWTVGGYTPSAKMTVWNEAMYYFHLAPPKYRKVLFALRHERAGRSLATHYLQNYGHLIPKGVEIWELDTATSIEKQIF